MKIVKTPGLLLKETTANDDQYETRLRGAEKHKSTAVLHAH